ncbi:hypothetical protein Tco_0683560 [Tanacetum coccineum]
MPSMNVANAKKAIQEMANHSQKWHNEMYTRTRSTNTFGGLAAIQAQLNNLGREINKVNEKVYAAQVGCESCKGPNYTKYYPLKEDIKVFEEAFYTQYGLPFPSGGRFRAAAPGFYERDNRNPSYQEQRQTMEESMKKFMAESAKRHDKNSILIKEIRSSTDAAIRNQGASIKALEIQIGRLTGDCYDEMNVLDSIIYGIFKEGQRMEDQVARSMIEDPLPQKEKDPRVVKNMDGYRDQDMGDDIFGEPFCKASCVEARRFDGLITIHNGNDNVSVQTTELNLARTKKLKKFLQGELAERCNVISEAEKSRDRSYSCRALAERSDNSAVRERTATLVCDSLLKYATPVSIRSRYTSLTRPRTRA